MRERTEFLITRDLTFWVLEDLFDNEKITLEFLQAQDLQDSFSFDEIMFIQYGIIYLKLSNLQPC